MYLKFEWVWKCLWLCQFGILSKSESEALLAWGLKRGLSLGSSVHKRDRILKVDLLRWLNKAVCGKGYSQWFSVFSHCSNTSWKLSFWVGDPHGNSSQRAVVQCQPSEEPTFLYAWTRMNDVALTLAKNAALQTWLASHTNAPRPTSDTSQPALKTGKSKLALPRAREQFVFGIFIPASELSLCFQTKDHAMTRFTSITAWKTLYLEFPVRKKDNLISTEKNRINEFAYMKFEICAPCVRCVGRLGTNGFSITDPLVKMRSHSLAQEVNCR